MKWRKIKSIKIKSTLVFSLVFFVMLILLLMVNQFFMDDFFKIYNKFKMTDAARNYESIVEKVGPQKAIENVSQKNGIEVFIFSENNIRNIKDQTKEKDNMYTISDLERFKSEVDKKNDGIYFEMFGDTRFDEYKLTLAKELKNKDLLVLSKKMGLAKEVSLLNFRFMLITSLFVYLITMIFIFVISYRFSMPIISMKNKTERMCQLDFSEKIQVNSIDEIGMLSKSINNLSDELSSSMKKLNQTNIKLNAELEKERTLEKMRRRFVSDVSHELKNPITMIQGFADGLIHNIPKTNNDREYYYNVIIEESVKMNKLIKDLLDLSSYESGTFKLNKENINLVEITECILNKYNNDFRDKNINVLFDKKKNISIEADSLRIEQVITNLLTNVLKYTNYNGNIKVKIEKISNKVKFVIANTGEIIPESELENIWDSFYQLDNTKKGSGLGLAIVKSIVLLHGGICNAYVIKDYNVFEIVV
ncbi:MAG: HAMP domain-containing sensor histidine kinase [Clostridiales bacterium]